MDIAPIIRRIQEGDRSAFAGVVRHFQGPLFGYLGRMGLGQAIAQELAQESFLRAWTHLAEFDPKRAQFSTWLFTIARNLALNELGSATQKHERLRTHNAAHDDVDSDTTDSVVCAAAQPPQVLEDMQRRLHLQLALRALSVQDRSALALAYFQELKLDDVARIEGCTVGAIKVRLHRAKQRLRELLENDHAPEI